MSSSKQVNIAIIGLGFGAEFIPIYQKHPNAVTSANWTCVGLLAHESSMNGGKIMKLPEFTLRE